MATSAPSSPAKSASKITATVMRRTTGTVVIMRDNKPVSIPPNTTFEFSAEEAAGIEKVNPKALSKIANVDLSDTAAMAQIAAASAASTSPGPATGGDSL